MDGLSDKILTTVRNSHPEIDSLLAEHQNLKEKVHIIVEKEHLSDEEVLTLSQLKKEKLLLKDRIEFLTRQKSA